MHGKKPDFRDKLCFCMLSAFERGKHPYQNDSFDDIFYHPHVNVVIFVPRKQSKKPQFFHKNLAFDENVFGMYMLVRFVLTF